MSALKNMLLKPLLLVVFVSLVSGFRLFPPEIFREHSGQQIIMALPEAVDHDNPQYSNSSFPGDKTGASPFFYCPESNPDTDIFAIYTLVLNPNLLICLRYSWHKLLSQRRLTRPVTSSTYSMHTAISAKRSSSNLSV